MWGELETDQMKKGLKEMKVGMRNKLRLNDPRVGDWDEDKKHGFWAVVE